MRHSDILSAQGRHGSEFRTLTCVACSWNPFLAAVPSSFSPFVEFKEKTQQWKLLGK